MGKAKFVMTLAFILAMGSGLLAGMLVMRGPAGGSADTAPRTPLAEELRLTPEQTQKMRDIWEGVRGKVDECFLRAQEAQKRRDESLLALLTDEQKAKLAQIQQRCDTGLAALKTERDAAFQDAVNRTEGILSEPQRQRYREILQSRLGQRSAADAPDWIAPQLPASMPGIAP